MMGLGKMIICLNKTNKKIKFIYRNTFGSINYFGGPSKQLLRQSQKLKEEMGKDTSKQILFFSDIWLDYPMVNQLFSNIRKYFIK